MQRGLVNKIAEQIELNHLSDYDMLSFKLNSDYTVIPHQSKNGWSTATITISIRKDLFTVQETENETE